MRFGVNGTLQKALIGMELGYDYAEIPVSRLRSEGEESIEALERAFYGKSFGAEAFNGFFPGEISIYDGGQEAIRYGRENVDLARRLGTKIMVIGSGKARCVPETMSKNDALCAFAEIVGSIAEEALPYGIRIAVEPLNYKETNLINTLEDCIGFSRMVKMENVGTMVDFYHFAINRESCDVFKKLKPGELIHVHVARPDESRAAITMDDAPAIELWKSALSSVGYDGMVTLEQRTGPDIYADYRNALPAMKCLQA